MIGVTMITPNVCHQAPSTSFHERDIDSVTPLRSMMNAGTAIDRNTAKMMPGMNSRRNPTPTTSAIRSASPIRPPSRENAYW